MAERKFVNPDERPADAVEKALLKRALGFTHKEVQTEEMFDKETGEVLSTGKRRVVSKEVLPDVRALLFWLKNRRPARWRERIELPGDTPEFEFDEDDEKL
ncbi:MAG TPA: hypothetical protein DFL85_01065 [Lentisphaeria bacterium]|uniref:hypothetical protein n=1 Tax=uncultured Victivallis sp. TaxID=354118 RepID=UPI000D02C20B|nr:hypothetical protein [uncultured Victivallis sp.]AVM44555.1 hypothetical protein C5Q97_07420 [Victivallales bacterium CCUG 44730]MBS5530879.1 hypothetical protein [bacterium]HBP06914.1 hypothetical protein [Lentisphaeria bacterium]HCH84084.1 hypothetical protein [Lentisphaeria bacterium]